VRVKLAHPGCDSEREMTHGPATSLMATMLSYASLKKAGAPWKKQQPMLAISICSW
jgi:hypothetical protein